jgi:hypothetical protein
MTPSAGRCRWHVDRGEGAEASLLSSSVRIRHHARRIPSASASHSAAMPRLRATRRGARWWPQDFDDLQRRRAHSASRSSKAPHAPARKREAAWPQWGHGQRLGTHQELFKGGNRAGGKGPRDDRASSRCALDGASAREAGRPPKPLSDSQQMKWATTARVVTGEVRLRPKIAGCHSRGGGMHESGAREGTRDSRGLREARAAQLIFFEVAFERDLPIYH